MYTPDLRTKFRVTIVFLILGLASNTYANQDFVTIEISTKQTSIRLGEPLAVKLTYKFDKAQVSPRTNAAYTKISHSASIQIEKAEDSSTIRDYPIYPFHLDLQDKLGLEYSRVFILWYNFHEEKLFLDSSGDYTIRVRDFRKYVSNPLPITVKPESDLDQKASSLLSDPNDCIFLLHGVGEPPNVRKSSLMHLKQVSKQCKGTLVAQWCAARVGVEYFEDFEHVRGHDKLEKGLLDEVHAFLNTGIELPDEFPIREEVLYKLARTEFVKGNSERGTSLLNELTSKYPKGRFASMVRKHRAVSEQKRDTEKVMGSARWTWSSATIVVAAGLSVLAIGIVFFVRKRSRNIEGQDY